MLDTNRTPFLNTFFDNISLHDVFDVIDEGIALGQPSYMVSLNLDYCIRLDKDQRFKEAYEGARLALIDSQPLTKLAIRNGIPVREKISGSDLMPLVCEHAADNGYSCYFFGGMPGVPETAAANMQIKYPELNVAGAFSPDYGFEKDIDKLADAIARVSVANPDILFMCLGMPKSELLLHDHLGDMGANFAFSVGAAIDFAAQNKRRAPKWMQDHSLEWFYRFLQEPNRMFKRYFIDSWQFMKVYWRYKQT